MTNRTSPAGSRRKQDHSGHHGASPHLKVYYSLSMSQPDCQVHHIAKALKWQVSPQTLIPPASLGHSLIRETHTHHFIDQQHSSQSLALILAPNLSTTCPRDGNFIFPSYSNTCIHILITCTNTFYPFPGSILLSRWSPSNWKQCAPKHADVARVPYQRSFSGLFYQNIKALSLLFHAILGGGHAHVCVSAHAYTRVQRPRKASSVLSYRSPPYSPETGALTELGSSPADSKPQQFSPLCPPQIWGFELRSSFILSQRSYLPKHILSPHYTF